MILLCQWWNQNVNVKWIEGKIKWKIIELVGWLSDPDGFDKFLSNALASEFISILVGYKMFSNDKVMIYGLEMGIVNLWIELYLCCFRPENFLVFIWFLLVWFLLVFLWLLVFLMHFFMMSVILWGYCSHFRLLFLPYKLFFFGVDVKKLYMVVFS